MPHTKAPKSKPQPRLEPTLQRWWQARNADVLTITPRDALLHFSTQVVGVICLYPDSFYLCRLSSSCLPCVCVTSFPCLFPLSWSHQLFLSVSSVLESPVVHVCFLCLGVTSFPCLFPLSWSHQLSLSVSSVLE